MDTTRRGFLAVAGAAVAGDAVHAQDHDHDDHAHHAVPSDPALPHNARGKVGSIVRDHGVFAFEDIPGRRSEPNKRAAASQTDVGKRW